MGNANLLERQTPLTPSQGPPRPVETLPTALVAECTCPGWCERDHDRD